MQQFSDWLVFKAHRLCVSLISGLKSNEEEEGPAPPSPTMSARPSGGRAGGQRRSAARRTRCAASMALHRSAEIPAAEIQAAQTLLLVAMIITFNFIIDSNNALFHNSARLAPGGGRARGQCRSAARRTRCGDLTTLCRSAEIPPAENPCQWR